MIFEPFTAFNTSEYKVKFSTSAWERREAYALRRSVFCHEQRIFAGDDRDGTDDYAIPIVALSMLGVAADRVVGTVRIHEEEPGLWWGSRLAVHSDCRAVSALGTTLIKLAVSSAHAFGCHTFLANVQSQNAMLFQRLHWHVLDEIEIHDKPHFRMKADLNHYPPCITPETGFIALPKRVA